MKIGSASCSTFDKEWVSETLLKLPGVFTSAAFKSFFEIVSAAVFPFFRFFLGRGFVPFVSLLFASSAASVHRQGDSDSDVVRNATSFAAPEDVGVAVCSRYSRPSFE